MSRTRAQQASRKKPTVRYESPPESEDDYYSDEYTPSDYSQYSDDSYDARRRDNRRGNTKDRDRRPEKSSGRNRRRDYTPSESEEEDDYDVVKGLPYLVDNSIIRAPTDGLGFRRSPNMSDRDGANCVKWGVVVFGIPIGTDWLQVGDRYLPMKINGTQILVPQVGALTGTAMTSKDFKAEARAKKSEDKKLLDRKIAEAQVIARKHQTEGERRRAMLEIDKQKKTEAATLIQARWRGYRSRQTVTGMILDKRNRKDRAAKRQQNEAFKVGGKKRQELAAIKIQSRARMVLARTKYANRLQEVKSERQKEEARQKANEELERKRQERERLKLWRAKREEAVVKLQNRARVLFSKKQVAEMKENYQKQARREENAQKKAMQQREAKAATKIQAMFRGKKARNDVQAISQAKQEEKRKQEREKEQRKIAAEKKRQEMEVRKEQENKRKREMAAITIQTRFRGLKARREYRKKVGKTKERKLLDKRLKAMKAQEISGRPLRFVAPADGTRPWDRWESKPPGRAKPVQNLRYNPKYGPPKFQTFATGESSIEQEVSLAERAIEERLTWAGTQRRLARPAKYMTEEAMHRTVHGDPFDVSPPGDLRAAVMDNGHMRASGVVGRIPLQPTAERKNMQQRLKRMEGQKQELVRSKVQTRRDEKEAAAIKIQATFRGRQARQRVAPQRMEVQRRNEKQRARQQAEKRVAAIELRNQKEMQRNQLATRREQERAAILLQRVWRGRQARRRLAQKRAYENQTRAEAAAVRAKLELRERMEHRLENLDLPIYRAAELGFADWSEVNGAGSCPPPSNGPMAAPRGKLAWQRQLAMGENQHGRGPSTPASAFSPARRGGGGAAGAMHAAGSGRPASISPGPDSRSPRPFGGLIFSPDEGSPGPGYGIAEVGAGALPPPNLGPAGKLPHRTERSTVNPMLAAGSAGARRPMLGLAGAANAHGSPYQGPLPSASGRPPPAINPMLRVR